MEKLLAGRSILVVEEEIRDALDLQDSFAEAGARVFTAYRMERALEHAGHTALSAAVIDISRGVNDSRALCKHLADRGIPFVFYCEQMPDELGEWVNVPLVTKPTDINSAARTVASLLNRATPAAVGNRDAVGHDH